MNGIVVVDKGKDFVKQDHFRRERESKAMQGKY